MLIDDELRRRIGLALNEANLLGVQFDRNSKVISCTFALVAMDKDGNVPEDNRLLFIFRPVGRFVASYRMVNVDSSSETVEIFEPDSILDIVQTFQRLPIYGWDFINCGDQIFDTWKDKLSFDYASEHGAGLTNTIDLFQDGGSRHLDLRIWFDDFEIMKPTYETVELEEFLDNGKRGWDAIYSNSEKMSHFGIIPSKSENLPRLREKMGEMIGEREAENWWIKWKDKIIGLK